MPWEGGPLFVPALQWKREDARDLAWELLAWMVFAERRDLGNLHSQIQNNLRSLQLAAAVMLHQGAQAVA